MRRLEEAAAEATAAEAERRMLLVAEVAVFRMPWAAEASAAARTQAEDRISAVRLILGAEPTSAERRTSVAGPRYRGSPRGPLSTVHSRMRPTATTDLPATARR
jgi:hypothetical protein